MAHQSARARVRFAALDETANTLALPDDVCSQIEADFEAVSEDDNPASAQLVDLSEVHRVEIRWRSAALAGIAATVLLALTLGWSLLTPVEPTVIAVLPNDENEAIALFKGRPDNITLTTLLEQADVPSERVMQVWTKPDDDGSPVPLGFLRSGRSETLFVDGLPEPLCSRSKRSPSNLPTWSILGKGLARVPVI